MSNQRVLVTGANGFVGKKLCVYLSENGFTVRGVLRRKDQVDSHSSGIDYRVVGEINQNTEWTDTLNDVDCVVHLAARVHVLKETSGDSLFEFRNTNVAGTKRLAEVSALNGVKRFIYISSVGVHGNKTLHHSFTEQDSPLPYDPYTLSKWEAEQVLQEIAKKSGMEVIVLRPPLIYGPNAPGNFGRLMAIIGKGIPLPLKSVGNLRSFIYLDNFVDAIVTCIKHSALSYQTVLVSDGQDISTPDLVKMIAHAMGKKVKLIPFPVIALKALGKLTGKSLEVERLIGSLQIDSSKIRNCLDWKPPYTIEQGISETTKWYLQQF